MDAVSFTQVGRWSPTQQGIFLEELARTGVVARASRFSGIPERSVYRLRLDPRAETFRRAWAAAEDGLYQAVLQHALARIVEGTPVDIVRGGEVVGQKTVHSDKLLMFMLGHLHERSAQAAAARAAAPVPQNGPEPSPPRAVDTFHAHLQAIETAAPDAEPVVPPVPDDDAPPFDYQKAREERLHRVHLRLDDYREQERDRAACEAEGRHWVPRAFKPLPPLRYKLPADPLPPSERYHVLKSKLVAIAACDAREKAEGIEPMIHDGTWQAADQTATDV